jgi:hypothetical protein
MNNFTVEQHLGPFDNSHPLHVADYAGVYFLFRRCSIVYVGKTKSVAARIAQHLGSKHFDAVVVMRVPEEMLSAIEMQWIQRLQPRLNRSLGRPKSGKDTVTFRLLPETKTLLTKAAENSGLDKSEYVEKALRNQFRRDDIT